MLNRVSFALATSTQIPFAIVVYAFSLLWDNFLKTALYLSRSSNPQYDCRAAEPLQIKDFKKWPGSLYLLRITMK